MVAGHRDVPAGIGFSVSPMTAKDTAVGGCAFHSVSNSEQTPCVVLSSFEDAGHCESGLHAD